MTITLKFPLAGVLRLAEHAIAAPGHEQSLHGRAHDLPTVACLVWVKDDGTYLTSNGIPALAHDPAIAGAANHVVYAEGWGSGTRQDLGGTPVGGDDFAEFIDLIAAAEDGPPLIDCLRLAREVGRSALTITVTDDEFVVRIR